MANSNYQTSFHGLFYASQPVDCALKAADTRKSAPKQVNQLAGLSAAINESSE